MRKNKEKSPEKNTVKRSGIANGSTEDFSLLYFPSIYFEFCHNAPKVPKTRVSYQATYRHWDKDLNLFRQFWHDSRGKTSGTADKEQDEKDRRTMTAQERIEKCYMRCQQAKDNPSRCNVCWEEDIDVIDFNDNDAWKIFYDHATFEEIVTVTGRILLSKPRYMLRELNNKKIEVLPEYPCVESYFTRTKQCPYKTCPDEVRKAHISRCSIISDYYKKWFQALRDNQDYFTIRLKTENRKCPASVSSK